MKLISNIKKIAICLIALILVLFSFSSGYSTHNIDNLAYVIAIRTR